MIAVLVGAVVAQNVFFFLIAAVMVVAALRVVTTDNIVHAALYLVVVLAGVAAQFLLLGAEFVGVTQVLVYIGAVIVLFLFGIMLTRAKVGSEEGLNHDNVLPAVLTAVLLALVMGYAVVDFGTQTDPPSEIAGAVVADSATVNAALASEGRAGDTVTRIRADRLPQEAAGIDVVVAFNEFTNIPGVLVSGATVGLFNEDGDLVDKRVTNTSGAYKFTDLDPGTYTVRRGAELGGSGLTYTDDADTVSLTKVKLINVLENDPTTVERVSDSIFKDYIVAFEAISVLLLAALIGAIVVARKE